MGPVLAGFISSAAVSITPASVTKVYGIDYSSEVFGIIVMFYGVSALTSPILSKAIGLSTSKDDTPYLILFEVGAGLALIGFLIIFTISEEPFDYDKEHRQDLEKMENNAIACEKEREEREIILEKNHKSKSKQVDDSSFDSPENEKSKIKSKSKLEKVNEIQINPAES